METQSDNCSATVGAFPKYDIPYNIYNMANQQILNTDADLTMLDSGAAVSVCPISYCPNESTFPIKKTRFLRTATGQNIEVYGKICDILNRKIKNNREICGL